MERNYPTRDIGTHLCIGKFFKDSYSICSFLSSLGKVYHLMKTQRGKKIYVLPFTSNLKENKTMGEKDAIFMEILM